MFLKTDAYIAKLTILADVFAMSHVLGCTARLQITIQYVLYKFCFFFF